MQDYSYKFGNASSRMLEPKVIRADKPYIGEHITLFTDRCVMCSRCVRFTREISGTAELEIINRGAHSEIDIFPGQPCNNKLAGNVVDLCPVGALCSKDFLYKQRVWWLKTRESVCPGCSTGCSIYVDENNEHVYRLRPRENHLAQGDFMCDEGRFGFKYIHAAERLTRPVLRSAARRPMSAAMATAWSRPTGRASRSCPRFAHQAAHARRARGRGRVLAVDDVRGRLLARGLAQAIVAERAAVARADTGGGRGRFVSKELARRAAVADEVYDSCREMPEPPRRRRSAQPFPAAECDIRHATG